MVEIVEVVVDLPERIGPRARLAINSHRPELPVRRSHRGLGMVEIVEVVMKLF
jgi:hypothetical protein